MLTPVKKLPPPVDSSKGIRPGTTPALKGSRPKNMITCIPQTPDGDVQEYSTPPLLNVTRRLQYNVTFASKRESISPVTFERDFYGRKDKVDGFETDFGRGMFPIAYSIGLFIFASIRIVLSQRKQKV
jgi:hypothetical protein